MSMLEKRIVNGYVELVDTRFGKVVARVPIDRSKMTSTLDRYEAAVKARNEQLEKQKRLDAQMIAEFWNKPMTY